MMSTTGAQSAIRAEWSAPESKSPFTRAKGLLKTFQFTIWFMIERMNRAAEGFGSAGAARRPADRGYVGRRRNRRRIHGRHNPFQRELLRKLRKISDWHRLNSQGRVKPWRIFGSFRHNADAGETRQAGGNFPHAALFHVSTCPPEERATAGRVAVREPRLAIGRPATG